MTNREPYLTIRDRYRSLYNLRHKVKVKSATYVVTSYSYPMTNDTIIALVNDEVLGINQVIVAINQLIKNNALSGTDAQNIQKTIDPLLPKRPPLEGKKA